MVLSLQNVVSGEQLEVGAGSFFSKHCISRLTDIYTHIQKTIHSHSFPHTTHTTHTQTQIHTHTHSHKYIHLQTYTYILTPHTNFHVNTQTVHILILTHRHAYLHTFIRSLAQSPVSQSFSSSRREQEDPLFPLSPFSKGGTLSTIFSL